MNNYCNDKIKSLNDEINELITELENPIYLSEKVIELILKTMAEIKDFISKRGFKNEEEEIHFFKVLKPGILSKLIYYNAIYKIETKMPYGGVKIIKKYLHNELDKIKRFFDNNLEFYKYYRTNSTYLDHKYFIRYKYDIKLSLDTVYFESDHSFSTSHDYKVAKVIANDLIQVYLEDKIFTAKNLSATSKSYNKKALNWTGSKTDLIEMIYALHSKSVFNNGNIDIKIIAKIFESTFNVELGDFYHTYMELKSRKINRTKFLDNLRDALMRKMDEGDYERE